MDSSRLRFEFIDHNRAPNKNLFEPKLYAESSKGFKNNSKDFDLYTLKNPNINTQDAETMTEAMITILRDFYTSKQHNRFTKIEALNGFGKPTQRSSSTLTEAKMTFLKDFGSTTFKNNNIRILPLKPEGEILFQDPVYKITVNSIQTKNIESQTKNLLKNLKNTAIQNSLPSYLRILDPTIKIEQASRANQTSTSVVMVRNGYNQRRLSTNSRLRDPEVNFQTSSVSLQTENDLVETKSMYTQLMLSNKFRSKNMTDFSQTCPKEIQTEENLVEMKSNYNQKYLPKGFVFKANKDASLTSFTSQTQTEMEEITVTSKGNQAGEGTVSRHCSNRIKLEKSREFVSFASQTIDSESHSKRNRAEQTGDGTVERYCPNKIVLEKEPKPNTGNSF